MEEFFFKIFIQNSVVDNIDDVSNVCLSLIRMDSVCIRDATIHFPNVSVHTSIFGSHIYFSLIYDLFITKN